MASIVTAEAKATRRILSIDGGGLRGVAAIAFLERLERRLHGEYGRAVALHEHFDLIGGSSTGAIIATSLALGHPLEQVKDHYFRLAPNVFRRVWNRIPFIHAIFSAEALQREFLNIVGERTLDTPDLKTGLAIIAKRVDTGSVWFLTNSPNAPYWGDPADGSYIGNRHYSLANIVRASTAAPHFFDPHLLEIVKGQPPGLFVDGGVSPYADPSLALLMIATIPAYGFGWPTGADRLEITSIGTGSYRYRIQRKAVSPRFAALFAVDALRSMIADNSMQTLTLMQALGRCVTPWTINSEIGNLRDVCIAPEPLFTFRRYDLMLERDWMKAELGEDIDAARLDRLRDISNLKAMERIYGYAERAAARQIV